ncbi:MAG: DUF1015 domain-containing protein [Clostridia bacterium]|nr:DUF1015 domain-containing protein [Clostridia bacterium]
MNKPIFLPSEILLPTPDCSLTKWSVIACDQYTSSPEYWSRVESLVGDSPSALRIVLPEIYLNSEDVGQRIQNINRTMKNYSETVLRTVPPSYLYIERTLPDGSVRKGILGMLDLESYSFDPAAHAPVRATEGTVLSRIPVRVQIRRDAPLELPHVMLLADDKEGSLFHTAESCAKDRGTLLYSFDLMMNAGSLKGWSLASRDCESLMQEFAHYSEHAPRDPAGFPMVFAVGDGNHSLAAAKTCYEEQKQNLGADALHHPSRYALAELVNLYDSSLSFEPIFRCVFGTDREELTGSFLASYPGSSVSGMDPVPSDGTHVFRCISREGEWTACVPNPGHSLPVGTLQSFLDRYLESHPGAAVDYIHGEAEVRKICRERDAVGFLFEGMDKSDLFPAVLTDGPLPRKTFSMGEADDKRFYLECRKIL